MTTDTAPDGGRMRLFYHRTSSASMRVTLYLRCRGIPAALVELVSTGFETDHRGIPVFTMPEAETQAGPGMSSGSSESADRPGPGPGSP